MKKYLIFDLDWTLIKSQKVLLELVSNYLKENFWIENEKSKYFLSSTRGMPLFEQIKEILGFDEHKAKEIANDIYKKIENTEKGNFFLWVPAKIKELRKNYKLFLSIRDEDKEIKQLWIIRYIDENSTSSACPVCNPKLYNVNSDDINKLYWHWKWEEKEKSMHHINDKNDENHQEWKWESWKLESWDLCDFHIWYNEKYPDFSFIKSWDDLATYNIAKKALEYLEYLKSLNNDETK